MTTSLLKIPYALYMEDIIQVDRHLHKLDVVGIFKSFSRKISNVVYAESTAKFKIKQTLHIIYQQITTEIIYENFCPCRKQSV